MAFASVPEWSTTASSNTELDGISLAENVMRPPAVNNAFREMMSQLAAFTRRGTDLATASTLNLDSVDNEFLDLTGTTTVTAVTLTDGHSRRARATGAFQLTASASLVVNGSTSTNYTTTAGDLLFFEGYSGGVVRVWIMPNSSSFASSTVGQGRHTIFVPATAMTPATTNGAAVGSGESTTNKVMRRSLDFDATTAEYAQFFVQMPKSWNEGSVYCQFVWSHASTTTNFGVVWGLEAQAFADGDAIDSAWGTQALAADTGGTTDRVYISAELGPITVAGSPGNSEFVAFRVARAPANASDTMAIDARLHGISIYYTTNAATDD